MSESILTLINHAIEEYRANRMSERFKEICDRVLEARIPQQCLKFCKSVKKVAKYMDVKPFGEIIAELGTPQQNYEFICKVSGTNSRLHRNKIIESESIEYNLLAVTTNEVRDALKAEYAEKHGEVLLKKAGVMVLADFLISTRNLSVNRNPYLNRIIESKNPTCNLKVSKWLDEIDLEPHSLVVAEFGSAKENMEFAKIERANQKRHLQAVAKSQDPEINLQCVIQIKNIPVLKHLHVVFNSNNNALKYEAVVWANGLEQGVLKELQKHIPQVSEFIKDVKAGKIDVNQVCYRFLNVGIDKTR